jgi:hypothetical protein
MFEEKECVALLSKWHEFVNHQTFGRCNKATLNNVEVFLKQF